MAEEKEGTQTPILFNVDHRPKDREYVPWNECWTYGRCDLTLDEINHTLAHLREYFPEYEFRHRRVM